MRRSLLGAFPATSGLLALLVAIFLVELVYSFLAGVSLGSPESTDLLRGLGANDARLVVWHDQWWRLVTATLLHGGLLHLAMNGWALWQLGRLSEITFGTPATLGLFVFTGITGSWLSLFSGGVSVGASGALFGIEGALVAFFLRHREKLTLAGRSLLKQLLIWSAAVFVIGFLLPNIDWLGHLGGFLGGIAIGWFMKPRIAPRSGAFARMVGVLSVIILLGSIALAWTASPLP